jgi:type IV fimbrial biogenesis protein FimT
MARQNGITLLELLVTMAIVAVLLATAVPSFRSYVQNQELRGAAGALASDLYYARNAAVDRGARVTVCPGDARSGCRDLPAWEDGWIVFGDDNGDRRWQAEEPLLRVSPMLEGISARSSRARRQLSFFPNGSAPGSNVTVRLCDDRGPAHGRQVRVSLSGRIRTTSASEDGPAGC